MPLRNVSSIWFALILIKLALISTANWGGARREKRIEFIIDLVGISGADRKDFRDSRTIFIEPARNTPTREWAPVC
jgi:hypothetical protein